MGRSSALRNIAGGGAGRPAVFYRDLTSACFDEPFARTRGVPVLLINTVLVIITSVAVVLAFKVVGIFLISAMLIIPPVSALLVSHTFKQVLVCAACFGVASVWLGVYLSFCLISRRGLRLF